MLLFHNLLIVDSLSAQRTADVAFWTWKGVLAICVVLVILGKFIDWLHRKRHKEAMLKKLSEFEKKLGKLPVREWQLRIAQDLIRVWEWLGQASNNLLMRLAPWLSEYEPIGRFGPNNQMVYIRKHPSFLKAGALLTPLMVLVVLDLFSMTESLWHVTILLVSPTGYVILALLLVADRYSDRMYERLSNILEYLVYVLTYGVAAAFLVSSLFTGCAIGVGLAMGPGTAESYWFILNSGSLTPARPMSMSLLNFPFDLVTILVSIRLLQFVKEKGKHIVWIALIDIIISAALVVLLHTTLKAVEPGGLSHIGQNFADSWNWFIQVVTFQASPSHPDWPLTPTLFTTFIPVTLYMSAFIFLGIIIKPFARAASYICGLLFEKKQTPFLAFSLILSGLLTVAKALSEWQWFVHQFKQLLG